MYAVILAGGGGTRLHPLSRPERPKPFLPLLGERSLLQATATGVRRPDRRHHGRHRPALRAARPRPAPGRRAPARADGPQHGRRHRARDARHRPARRRGHARPAGRPDRPSTDGLPATSSTPRPSIWRPARSISTSRSSRSASQVDRPATEYGYLMPEPRTRRGHRRARVPIRCLALRGEAEARPGRGARHAGGRRLERRASSCGGGGRSARRSSRYTGLLQSLGPMVGAPSMLEHAYEAIQRPVSIDYAVMEGAAAERPGRDGARWTSAGPTSARGRRCSRRSGRTATGAVVQAGETRRGRARRPGRPPGRRPARGHRAARAR